jgi:hypothetical protein
MKKLALASLKVFKKDLEEFISEFLEDLGLDKYTPCKASDESEESLLEEIETKREKVIKKTNAFFDKLKDEIREGKSSESQQGSNTSKSDFENLTLSIKELTHKVSRLQEDINEIKAKG